jgi:MFS family permease
MDKLKEKPLLYILAFIQFTHVMDFMVMMPLSTLFMSAFAITNTQFGLLVASYNISAGVISLVGSFFVDRFDRRKVVIVCYTGFILGTLACGLAPSYELLLAARIFTGLFGGVLSSSMLSIVGDAIPFERRATAMSIVYMGFSAAAIIGVPAGSLIAAHSSWHIPFLIIAGMGVPIFFGILRFMPRMDGHVEEARKRNPLQQFWEILSSANRLRGLSLMALLMIGHFSIIPYIPNYMVHNVGIKESYIGYIYLVGGLVSVVSMRLVGFLSDKVGSFKVFAGLSIMACLPIYFITNLPVVGLTIVLILAAALFVFGGSRGVPANTLITSAALPHQRGGFLSLNAGVQQLSSGFASFLGGLLIAEGPNSTVLNYHHVGYLAIAASLIAIPVAMSIKPAVAATQKG